MWIGSESRLRRPGQCVHARDIVDVYCLQLQIIVVKLLAFQPRRGLVPIARSELETDAKRRVIEVDDVRVAFDVWSGGVAGGQRAEMLGEIVCRG